MLGRLFEQVAAQQEPLLTLRQVAEMSETPLSTVKRWVYDDGVLEIVRVGPHGHPRVRWSVFVAVFRQQNPSR
jgi:hypothetical protein